jgi:NADPH:quinone reductase-like Zn-dependent oxidoreductase
MNSTMRALRATGAAARPIAFASVPIPEPQHAQTLVRVHAISLNAGEVRRAPGRAPGDPLGWDFAGTVARGPRSGERVVGLMPEQGAWAEYVAAPDGYFATLPAGISFADAATLPVAGLTALRALRHGAPLPGKHVLISPGTGGAGLFAIQLAAREGARVTASARRSEAEAQLRAAGADAVVIGEPSALRDHAPFDVVLESLGGAALATALTSLAPDGIVVHFGQSVSGETTFASNAFYLTGGARLYGFVLFHEAEHHPVTADLGFLAGLVARNELATNIEATIPFDDFAAAFERKTMAGRAGKIVVTLPERTPV